MLDSVRLALIVALCATVLALAAVVVVAWNNGGSRNLALATGTLCAAFVLFLIQLPFELRSTEQHDLISVELTLDRKARTIRQWTYPTEVRWRIHAEVGASEYIAKQNSELFDGDRDRLTSDMLIFSLVSYIAANEFDWQRQTRTYVGSTVGRMMTSRRISKPTECTVVDKVALRKLLKGAGNIFSDAPLTLVAGSLCLPPQTTLSLTTLGLKLQNPYCAIEFCVEPFRAVSYAKPGTSGDVPKLDSGEAQLETRIAGLAAVSKCAALRAQHPAMAKYRAWASGLVAGVHEWFEGEAPTGPDTGR